MTIRKLVYVGESQNVRDRIFKHEKWKDWCRHLNSGEVLCFNFAPLSVDRGRVEAALINHHKPPENTEYVYAFPYPQTTARTSGRNKLLSNEFTAHQTRQTSFV